MKEKKRMDKGGGKVSFYMKMDLFMKVVSFRIFAMGLEKLV